jgi:replicative DNA helicase
VPYRTLQRVTGGLRPGNLWYVASRPNQGKSAHLCNMATKALLDGCRVMFYSLEMSEMEVRFRFHTKLAAHYGYPGITLTDLRDRRVDKALYKTFVSELDDRIKDTGGHLNIHTPADGMITPSLISSRADEYHLNVIDYIGLMKTDTGIAAVSDWRIAAGISNDLKLLAGASASSFLVASQINREGDHGSAPPKISQLSQSDALGQDGDVVLTFRSKPHDVATHFMVDKNRHGPRGIEFFTVFDPNKGQFHEITKQQAEDLVIDAEADELS